MPAGWLAGTDGVTTWAESCRGALAATGTPAASWGRIPLLYRLCARTSRPLRPQGPAFSQIYLQQPRFGKVIFVSYAGKPFLALSLPSSFPKFLQHQVLLGARASVAQLSPYTEESLRPGTHLQLQTEQRGTQVHAELSAAAAPPGLRARVEGRLGPCPWQFNGTTSSGECRLSQPAEQGPGGGQDSPMPC